MTTINMPNMDEMTPGLDYVSSEGWGLFIVKKVDLQPTDSNNQPIQGLACRLTVQCEQHEVATERGKLLSISPKLPNPSSRDNGRFQGLILARLAYSLGILPPAQPGQPVTIDWNQAANRYLVGKVSRHTWIKDDGSEGSRHEIQGLHFYPLNELPDGCPRFGTGAQQQAAPAAQPQQPAPQPAQPAQPQQPAPQPVGNDMFNNI